MIPGGSFSFKGLHFLVVDDQRFIRHFVSQHLTSVGVRDIAVASDGSDAINQIRTLATVHSEASSLVPDIPVHPGDISRYAGNFDCIIADFHMQPLTGLHVLKAVRTGTSGAPRGMPVVLLTSHSDGSLVSTAMALDANAFVLKPVTRDALVARIEQTMVRPVDLKDLTYYESVPIPGIDDIKLTKALGNGDHVVTAEQDIPKASDDKAVLVALEELKVGAVLATPIKGENGETIVAGGAALSADLIDRLLDLHDLAGVSNALWVRRSTASRQ